MNYEEYRKDSGIVYPPFALTYFEKYFFRFMDSNNELIKSYDNYIPVYWTEMQNSKSYNKEKLQQLIDELPKDKQYYTVVQHDDGITDIILPDNVVVFGMGGVGNINLPLTYDNPELFDIYKNQEKSVFCSFVGSLTNSCRRIMVKSLHQKSDVILITDNWTNNIADEKQKLYINVMSRSRFTLAPRGYGKTSFRLYEALNLNSIPVYIYDDCFLPYCEIIDWSKMIVLVHISEIDRLYETLKQITDEKISDMLAYYKQYQQLFTYEGMANYVISKFDK